MLFDAIHQKCYITVDNLSKRVDELRTVRLVPLKIYISALNGRQHLIAFHEKSNRLNSYRLDYLSNVRLEEPCEKYDALKRAFAAAEGHMWGVNCRWSSIRTEHMEFNVHFADDEQHILRRLEREKRCGRVERLNAHTARFSADVFDANEMLPWIRTFTCRITRISFSNKATEGRFLSDLQTMYAMYGIEGGVET